MDLINPHLYRVVPAATIAWMGCWLAIDLKHLCMSLIPPMHLRIALGVIHSAGDVFIFFVFVVSPSVETSMMLVLIFKI